MFDTHAYERMHGLTHGSLFERYRSRKPTVWNIETTSHCNMRCRMCPRTTMMTRKPSTMPLGTFANVVSQLTAPTREAEMSWRWFCEDVFGIAHDDAPSENHFYLHTMPWVVQLHGYGDPLLDPHIAERIALLTERGLRSYFSCNPANVDQARINDCLRAGLGVVKFSIESTDDERFRSIRGNKATFTQAFDAVRNVVDARDHVNPHTQVVVTMLDLGASDSAAEFARLREAFDGVDVYLYHKSEDTQWLRPDGTHGTNSIHWSTPCLHPWTSMTVLANGDVGACMETFDEGEFALGNVNDASLEDIWNGEAYAALRRAHLTGKGLPLKCQARCDMPVIGGRQ